MNNTANKNANGFGKNKFVPNPNGLVKALQVESNFTLTTNGALTNKSTLNSVLDWFAAGGALRTRSAADVNSLFSKAFSEDRLLALKILFYFRDRIAQGERKTTRVVFNWLANNYPDILRKNLENIPFYGRWDDLYILIGTPLEADVYTLFEKQLTADIENFKANKPVSLLAKWLKSVNTSSQESRNQGYATAKALHLSPKKYRKILSKLRSYINVLETKMCANDWTSIDFEKVPSKASLIYRKAFGKHDQVRYADYLTKVEKGEAKINASVVFPYEILRALVGERLCNTPSAQEIKVADLQWNAMPDFMEGNELRAISMSDLSGSMTGLPMLVSISLGIYFAERNIGAFKDYWINFSTSPSFQKLIGNNLYEKFSNMDKHNWSGSTNLQSAFNLILSTAIQNGVKESDMPNALFIISDMEFNNSGGITNFDAIKMKYKMAGYKLPKLVWWNVNAVQNNNPVRHDENGNMLVSGCSPSILKTVMAAKQFDPMSAVYDVANQERYNRVTL